MSFTGVIAAILGPIIRPIIQEEIGKLKNWLAETVWDIGEMRRLGGEAKQLQEELKGAQSESERKAILRKISKFSDLANLTLNRVQLSEAPSKSDKVPDRPK